MRLTLRTMLAYMDDILDPEDAEALRKKIEESDFATGLLHRTRDCMRRLRLGAPKVTEHGTGLDPNTVAEYLDNTLPSDRVPDFEKVCLESDIHLAEVASCHQILTLVLGEPAEVDPASRLRMYRLPELVTARLKAAGAPAHPPEAEPAAGQRRRDEEPTPAVRPSKPEVPDYLRAAQQRKRRLWQAAAAVVLLLVLGIVVMAATGQFGPGTPMGNLFCYCLGEKPSTQAPPATRPAEVEPSEIQVPTKVDSRPEPAALPPERALPSDTEPGARPEAPKPEAKPAVEPPVAPGPEQVVSIPTKVPPGQEAEKALAKPSAAPAPGPPAEPAPLPPERIGLLASPTEVLLKFDATSNSWHRVADRAPLISGNTFLSLPTYRPLIVLANEMRLLLIDGTRIQFLPADQDGNPGLVVDYGRLVIRTAEKAEAGLRLQVGERTGVISFGDPESTLAVEVARELATNVDPEAHPAALRGDLYATTGTIFWRPAGTGEPLAINAPERLTLNDQPPRGAAAEKLPDWLEVDTITLLDQRASGTVEEELRVQRPADLTLRELAEHRRREVRQLALRCLALIDDFEPLVKALDDPDEKMIWPDCLHIEQLRAAVARGPSAAAEVRTAMEKLYGSEGTNLYELLWKYSAQGLNKEDAQQLVQYLEHDSLAFRRLGFWNLKRITGMGLYYRPEDTAAQRHSSVQKWRQRLKDIPAQTAQQPEENQRPSGDKAAPPGELIPGLHLE